MKVTIFPVAISIFFFGALALIMGLAPETPERPASKAVDEEQRYFPKQAWTVVCDGVDRFSYIHGNGARSSNTYSSYGAAMLAMLEMKKFVAEEEEKKKRKWHVCNEDKHTKPT